ncbi:MAG: hypothetical protein HDR12_02615 [Lachnospiraceae bacterium]|nr:hypothetical protein [Lachnospiraceae bacterium]
MRIGGLSSVYPTYVYNPVTVSSKSMNKLSRISDDVLDKKVDYSGVEAKEENQNPLKKGETIDFEGMLAKQMQQGRNRAAKIMPEGLKPVENREEMNNVAKAKDESENAVVSENATMAATANEADAAGSNMGSSMMQRAIQAYEMFMIA